MSVTVVFPEALLVASREDRATFARRAMIATLGQLYQEGKISSSIGAGILGCDRWEFYRLLTDHGFAVIDYAADEEELEAATSRTLAENLPRR